MIINLVQKLLVFFILSFFFAFHVSSISAATIPYQITTGLSGIFAPGFLEVFYTTELVINYQVGQIFLSANLDGTGNTQVDDIIEIIVQRQDGSIQSTSHRYPDNICASLNSLVPSEFTYLFLPGDNQVTVKLKNICGSFGGSSSLYLVNINAPDPTPTPTPTPTPSPTPLPKTPLILIPGIGGSELKVLEDTIWSKDDGHGGIFTHTYLKDEKVWVNEAEAAKPGEDDYFDVLRMKEDGINSEAELELTGDLYNRSYEELINFFVDNNYTLSQDLFLFPYDWRLDLSGTATLLDEKIQEIKSQTSSEKVDIVVHSMGGLVARNYIADPTRAQNVRKLFTLGAPHLGSVKFLQAIRHGVCLVEIGPLCPILASSEAKDVLQNMIGGFELAPSQNYFNFYSGEDNYQPYPYRTELGPLNYSQIKNLFTMLGHNTSLFNPSEIFHAIDSSLSNTNGVEVFNIVGSGQSTLGQIIEQKTTSLLGIETIEKDVITINGDDTVPLYSASLNDPSKNLSYLGSAKLYYTNQRHGDLVINGPALNLIKNILEENDEIPEGISTEPYKFKGISLSVHSPVNIHVYDVNNNHTGPIPDGHFEVNIPDSSYDTLGDAKFIFLPDDGVYTINFEAISHGSFDFKIRRFEDDVNNQTILYEDIPLTDNTAATIVFDTQAIQPPVIHVDKNGDGTIDTNETQFSILNGEANYDHTPPQISFDVNPKTIWPPNGKMVDISIKGNIIDENPYLTTVFVDDEYNLVEPTLTTYYHTDYNQTIKLKAARNEEDKDGRKYIIRVFVQDLAGNSAYQQFEVIVPHDQR